MSVALAAVQRTEQVFDDGLRHLADVGYFGERLANARNALVHAWWARASSLTATAHGTDIFGALTLASEIFHSGSNKFIPRYRDNSRGKPKTVEPVAVPLIRRAADLD